MPTTPQIHTYSAHVPRNTPVEHIRRVRRWRRVREQRSVSICTFVSVIQVNCVVKPGDGGALCGAWLAASGP